MKILLTGHKGFIGSYVYSYLKNVEFDVDGFDRPDELKDFKTDKIYDIVIHLAAYAALRDSKKNPNKLNYIYILTPKGISEKPKLTINFMKRKMKEYDELKKELDE